MRSLGLALVVIGALMLGYAGLSSATQKAERTAVPEQVASEDDRQPERSPRLRLVYGGIVLVTGLILLVSNGRSD